MPRSPWMGESGRSALPVQKTASAGSMTFVLTGPRKYATNVMARRPLLVFVLFCIAACSPPTEHDRPGLLLTGGLIVDPVREIVDGPKDILIADGRIVRVADSGQTRTTDGVVVVDASGLFLLPGLIDVHAHIGDGGLRRNTDEDRRQALQQFLRYGVTSIFVPGGGGGNDRQMRDWKAYCDRRPARCPGIFGSGDIITAHGSHPITTIWGMDADEDPELIRARGAVGIKEHDSVDDLLDEKIAAEVDAIKIVVDDGPGAFAPKPRLSKSKVAEICGKAEKRGLRVFAHVSLAEHVVDVVESGCNGIMHAPDDIIDDETLKTMASREVFYVATLSLFDALLDQETGHRDQDAYAIAGVSPAALQSLNKEAYWAIQPESPELIASWQHALSSNLQRAAEFGVPIALGTDTNNPQVFPGYSAHEELQLMVAAGLSESQALRSATVTAAKFLQEQRRLGSIAPGYRADIVGLNANPFDDILNTRTIEFVLAGGDFVEDIVAAPE